MAYGIVNIDEIIRFFSKEITREDIKNLNISTEVLEKYIENPIEILNGKLSDVKIVHDFLQNRNKLDVDYLGIDLGTKTFMTCSDKKMNQTYTLNSTKIEKAIEKYQNKMLKNESEKREAVIKFNKQIEEPISFSIKELNKVFKPNITYIIGLPDKDETTKEFYKLANVVIRLFKQYQRKYGYKIYYVRESNTSITCPNCYQINKKYRRPNNKFKCENCKFEHDNDHEVAACNIVNRYLRKENSK